MMTFCLVGIVATSTSLLFNSTSFIERHVFNYIHMENVLRILSAAMPEVNEVPYL